MNPLRAFLQLISTVVRSGPCPADAERIFVVIGSERKRFVGRSGKLADFKIEGPLNGQSTGLVFFSADDAVAFAYHCNLESVIMFVLDRTPENTFTVNDEASAALVNSVNW